MCEGAVAQKEDYLKDLVKEQIDPYTCSLRLGHLVEPNPGRIEFIGQLGFFSSKKVTGDPKLTSLAPGDEGYGLAWVFKKSLGACQKPLRLTCRC